MSEKTTKTGAKKTTNKKVTDANKPAKNGEKKAQKALTVKAVY